MPTCMSWGVPDFWLTYVSSVHGESRRASYGSASSARSSGLPAAVFALFLHYHARTRVKSALSFTLIVCLMPSTVPLAAQENREPTGLLAAAIIREAVRLAAAEQSQRPDDWPRVRRLAAGGEILVTTSASQSLARYYVQADDDELTVLNLSRPTLSPDARRVLLDTLSHHPEVFGPVPQVRSQVQVGPDGVFVAGQKVAELQEVLQRIARGDVLEIAIPTRTTRGSLRGAVEFAALGLLFSVPLYVASAGCPSEGNCGAWGLRQTSIFWLPAAGGLFGYFALGQRVHGRVVIFRAQ
jgi:hypothetical protein